MIEETNSTHSYTRMPDHTRSYFFTGIGGIGMSALAQLLKEEGHIVAGSDREESPVTELLVGKGIDVAIGQKAENLPAELDVLVYSDAVPEDNPERARASERGIPQLSYFEALGQVSESRRTVAVAGTHGKTTTTGMLAKILHDAGAEPTAVVGSIVRDFGSNYLSGSADAPFVVEACEYKRHFLSLAPEVLVITNIEFDHTDYFADLADVQDAFRTLAKRVPAHGYVVTDTEHPNIAPVLQGLEATVIDYQSEPVYPLRLPGEFNEMNARAAAAAAKALHPRLTTVELNRALESFHGTWRRFEKKGERSGVTVYDDYAHHPTAIKETLRALRARTDGRVFVAFHPHLYSRTRDLLDGFARSFADADVLLIAPIYPAREIDDGTISSEMLAERIRAEGVSARALSFDEIAQVLMTEPMEGDVIMTMGAGDIYKVADALVA